MKAQEGAFLLIFVGYKAFKCKKVESSSTAGITIFCWGKSTSSTFNVTLVESQLDSGFLMVPSLFGDNSRVTFLKGDVMKELLPLFK